MALTLGQGAQMIADVGYQARIRAAMMRSAITVTSEVQGAQTVNVWNARRQLAGRILQSPDAYLAPFMAAIAADQFTPLSWFAPVSIASSTNANPSVVTTPIAHGLVVGDVVEVVGHLVNTAINGVWTLAVVGSTTTFTIPAPASGVGGATGSVMKMNTDADLVSNANQVFGAIVGFVPA